MPRKKSTSDEVILDSAKEVFLADGVGASTRKIAQVAGVSEGVLFQRFGSKQTLFFRAMRLPAPDLSEALETSQKTSSYHEALLELATAALEYFRNVMPMVLLVLSHPSSKEMFSFHGEHAHELLFESFGLNTIFVEFFNKQVQEKVLVKRDYVTLTDMLLSTLLTRALHEQIGLDSSESARSWLDTVVKVLID